MASGKGLGPLYFGYGASVAEPVRVGVIGTGDEGSVLLGAINPKYIAVKAIADIRPYNVWRAFHGDFYSAEAHKTRRGLMSVYGWKTEAEAKRNVKVYGPYQDLIAHAKQDGIEAVIIALPLHLHAPAAVAAMKAGLHVMTEKLMGHSVHECKEMARVAKQTNLLLAVGHQRHYNILYDDAVEMIRKGLLGELHHIRAQWHRGNLPGNDSWQQPMPQGRQARRSAGRRVGRSERLRRMARPRSEKLKSARRSKSAGRMGEEKLPATVPGRPNRGRGRRRQEVRLRGDGNQGRRGQGGLSAAGRSRELIRWRLWDRTGGGLMAELGSHQLDAASIFIAAAHGGQKQHPLSVAAAANRPLFPPDRDVEDHVYCIFEFPAPGYDPKDPIARQKKIGVQYASINGNGFGGYGETVFGTEGTLVLETEKEAMLFKTHETTSKTKVALAKTGSKKDAAVLKIEEKRRSRVGRHRHAGDFARRTRLHRGAGALGVVHPQPLAGKSAALPSEGGHGRRGDRPDGQHGRPARANESSSRRNGSTSTATRRRKA